MSFRIVEQTIPRLNRSELAVPGSQPKLFEKAAKSAADIVLLDLEDSVAPDDKAMARKNVIAALKDIDWGRRTVAVRLNGLDTEYMYRDVVDIVEQAGAKVDLFMIPKVGTPGDVYAVDVLVSQVEKAMGLPARIGIEILIETALGMMNVDAIAGSSRRIESLHFGVGDYAASTRARTTKIGGGSSDYAMLTDAEPGGERLSHWGDMWHYALARIVVAARAHGLRPVDGPLGDFGDVDGFKAAARRAAALGCEGKWAIHPTQIAPANEIFTPSAAEIDKARRILATMESAAKDGKGAIALDGRMIDIASIKQAEALVKKADRIAAA